MERAYCKDILVKPNSKTFIYPEYPNPIGDAIKKIVPNMWKNWLDDSGPDLNKSFKGDTEEIEIHKYIKKPEDAQKCL